MGDERGLKKFFQKFFKRISKKYLNVIV